MGRIPPIIQGTYTPLAIIVANTGIDLAGKFPKMERLLLVTRIEFTTAVFTSLTIVTTTPAAGEVQLTGSQDIEFGDATTASELYLITYIPAYVFSKLTG